MVVTGDLYMLKSKSKTRFSSFSAQGKRQEQEDRFLFEKIHADIHNGQGQLLAVMDGHCGSTVCDLVYKNLVPFFMDALMEKQGSIFGALENTIADLQALCIQYQAGSTLSIVYIPENQEPEETWAYTAVIGDSPVLIKTATGNRFTSVEHNAAVNQSDIDLILRNNREMAEQGLLYVSGGFVCLSMRYLQLTRSLGDSDYNGIILREPTIEKVPLNSDSIIVVASDGVLTDENRDSTYQHLMKMAEGGKSAEALVRWALENDSHDNVTVLIYRPVE